MAHSSLYQALRSEQHVYQVQEVTALLARVNAGRVARLARSLAAYITANLPAAIDRRTGLADYRTNPYVLMTSAKVMNLAEPDRFASFLFHNKLYMGLETSFGKSIESVLVGEYPLTPSLASKWIDAPEKVAEHQSLAGLSNLDKARARNKSIWREVDKSLVTKDRRYLVSIKSGPHCINDTQVEAMKEAIANQHSEWMKQTRSNHPEVKYLDVVIGITYGTDRTTNNKENQILAKLLEHGFVEEDRVGRPGVLIKPGDGEIRVYRKVGQDFWAFIGSPENPDAASHAFLEILIALAKALPVAFKEVDLESRLNRKIQELASALARLSFPCNSLPEWVRESLPEDALLWLVTAMTAFYDAGI